MVIDHYLLQQGIVQFCNNAEKDDKKLGKNYPIFNNFQNQRTVDACELFANEDEPKSKRVYKRAKRSS